MFNGWELFLWCVFAHLSPNKWAQWELQSCAVVAHKSPLGAAFTPKVNTGSNNFMMCKGLGTDPRSVPRPLHIMKLFYTKVLKGTLWRGLLSEHSRHVVIAWGGKTALQPSHTLWSEREEDHSKKCVVLSKRCHLSHIDHRGNMQCSDICLQALPG